MNKADVHPEDRKCVAKALEVEEKEGLIGLIANSLMNKYKKPSSVFTYNSEQGILKGSCRSQEGFNVVEAFNYCGDLLITAGGHALAGGCSIYKKDLKEFEKKLLK